VIALTPRQAQLVRFIDEYWKKYNFAPAYKDMCAAMSDLSKSGISRLLTELRDKGWVTFMPFRQRSVRLTSADPYSDVRLQALSTPQLSELVVTAGAILSQRRRAA
jgi:SOS-response transcriptional repressor LexA